MVLKKLNFRYVLPISMAAFQSLFLCGMETNHFNEKKDLKENYSVDTGRVKEQVVAFKKEFEPFKKNIPIDDAKKILNMYAKHSSGIPLIMKILQNKENKAYSKIVNEWGVSKDDVGFIKKIKYGFDEKEEGEVSRFSLRASPNRKEYFLKQTESKEFKDLCSTYLVLIPAKKVNISFLEDERGCIGAFVAKESEEKDSLNFGGVSLRIELILGDDFFNLSKNSQEYLIAHESAHAFMSHLGVREILIRFCVIKKMLLKRNKKVPTVQEWLERTGTNDWGEFNTIIENNKNEFNQGIEEVRESSSFLALSRAFEYQSDSVVACYSLEKAKIMEKGLYEVLPDSDFKTKKSTHPSTKKRKNFISNIRKILEIEKNIE